jgi:hypothetical protein
MKELALVAVGLVALATAGFAAAWESDNGRSVTAVSGLFTATTVSNYRTRSCTTTNGKTIVFTKGTYAGADTSTTGDLNGAITLDARSVIDTTDGLGTVEGKLKIGDTAAHFKAVYDHGNLAGLAEGHAATPDVQLLGNLSAAFNNASNGGFTAGKIGGGTSAGSAVELGPNHCAPSKSQENKSGDKDH